MSVSVSERARSARGSPESGLRELSFAFPRRRRASASGATADDIVKKYIALACIINILVFLPSRPSVSFVRSFASKRPPARAASRERRRDATTIRTSESLTK